MLNTRQNIHHSQLPKLGEIVELPGLSSHMADRNGKWIVESFPLCDNVLPYSKGIHTVNLRKLGSNERINVSGFWCDVMCWM